MYIILYELLSKDYTKGYLTHYYSYFSVPRQTAAVKTRKLLRRIILHPNQGEGLGGKKWNYSLN